MTTGVEIAELLTRVRETTPLVQCITNSVVTNFTANVLLAAGAAPAMVDIPQEAGMFATMAGGLLVNTGTPTAEQRAAAREAVAGAGEAGTPWVLDPVAIGALPVRTALAAELAEQHPAAVRGNASEILALAGAGSGGRGVESSDSISDAAGAARELASRLSTVVAVSGPVDLVTDGTRVLRLGNGHELLTRVTGGGCALGAFITAFLAARADAEPLAAVVAAHTVYGIAAERAAAGCAGPGSFATALIDSLAALTAAEVEAGARVWQDSEEQK
ncbi:hydroxyethylthiazole kinase [Acidipropionibacterium jensenii]|uniref:Hydroxyethylthiazole kinase n=1 Tax=Acidipropionibacterium jensenii TaxID=1749 RepID=A0A3Q9ULA9_9ACTN|nr:hydroxyethylthiazole kinase [Acidipropionibacterium jensenii]AZZ39714.1 hydroxyethylthiazole kinase [Acidipropionibacterium jensenii]